MFIVINIFPFPIKEFIELGIWIGQAERVELKDGIIDKSPWAVLENVGGVQLPDPCAKVNGIIRSNRIENRVIALFCMFNLRFWII